MSLAAFIKDPQANLPYSIDWADWLDVGETLSTSTWAVTGPDSALTEGANTSSTTATTVVLSAGTVNRDYTVTNTVVTSTGWTDERSITIRVRQR